MRAPGLPALPQEGLFIAIPDDCEVKDIQIIDKKEKELEGEYLVLPASKPVHEGEKEIYIRDTATYESDEPYPGKYVELLGTANVAGRRVAHILIYPAQYRPKSKKLSLLESIDFNIIYKTRYEMCASPRKRTSRRLLIERMILDPERLNETKWLGEEPKRKTSNKASSGLKDPTNDAEYLIITTDDLKDSFDELIKAQLSARTVKLVTKTEIIQEFPNPKEDEAIKDFLSYAMDNWQGTPQWVVLGGDVDKIPTHIATSSDEQEIASDHFYADLRGDIIPEIVVSRIPISDPEMMKTFCKNSVLYGKCERVGRANCLLTTCNAEPPKYENCANEIAGIIGDHFNVIKRYDGQASKSDVIDAVNKGVGIINYRGHGAPTAWRAGNGLGNEDVHKLDNGKNIPMVWSLACWNNDIDMDGECFGEAWIKNMKAITFFGASRPSWTTENDSFNKYIFDGIVNQGLTKAGDIMNWAVTKLFSNLKNDCAIDNIRMYLLLGDPTADLGE
ncbi:MAG: Peptidase family C25 [Methanosaeta sp. PtaU1.Bin112]|nr:MAG: Peptidase family C25 [Methanosaeta sp. PtaU1.Bin112]